MKLSKELEERVKKAIEELEKDEKENKIKYYPEEEAMKMMFGELDKYFENAKKI